MLIIIILFYILLLIIGFVLLIFSANFLVNGSIIIATKFKVSEVIIGLTIVSIGTSMPELLISIVGSVGGNTGLVLGNVVGSNICNILLILGSTGLLAKKPIKISHVKYDITISIIGVIAILLFSGAGIISRIEALVLLTIFVFYMLRTIKSSQNSKSNSDIKTIQEIPSNKSSIVKAIIYIIIGLVGLLIGGKVVVLSASKISMWLGMSEKLVGLTIVAIGTSLPELVTSIAAVRKGNPDLAIGNVIGSNILNIYFILGMTSLISPIPYDSSFNFDLAVLVISSILLFLFMWTGKKDKLEKWESGILFVGYVSYIAYSIYRLA